MSFFPSFLSSKGKNISYFDSSLRLCCVLLLTPNYSLHFFKKKKKKIEKKSPIIIVNRKMRAACTPHHHPRATAALAAALAEFSLEATARKTTPTLLLSRRRHRPSAFGGEEDGDDAKEEETLTLTRRKRTTKRDALNAVRGGITTAARPDGRFRETSVDKAKSQALRFLAAKPRTKKELEIKLVEDKGYDIEDAREALDTIEQLGLHSDKLYSEQWARMKWRQSRWNKWKVASELKKRGVNEDDIEDGLWKVYADWERSLRRSC